ncbi:MAG: phytoene desaturase family protein [Bacteroidota bacterium]|nr:phytoene desaturase family protein [Bacteroidota bacterium]
MTKEKDRIIMKEVLVIGSGLGGLTAALRLSSKGYRVRILEKHSKPGGRLNQLVVDGFKFDVGPSFMSMTYILDEMFSDLGIKNPLKLTPLDPIYQVFFEGRNRPYKIWKSTAKLQEEFSKIEPDLAAKADKYLAKAGEFFNDTIGPVVKSNFDGYADYFFKLSRVPLKHLPYLFKNMWSEVSRNFSSEEMRIIFSLVAFFLGSTPFQTSSIYSLLSYTELKHDGYWNIEGGMYRLTEAVVELLEARGVEIIYNTEITQIEYQGSSVKALLDRNGCRYSADIYVSNSDAAAFRGTVLGRKKYSESNLDKMDWTLAPFTIYLGIKGKIDILMHHNYFLGNNFKNYSNTIFTSSISPDKPYYYVNASSKSFPGCAPEGCENLFILCPVPDMRYKSDWSDKEQLADKIIGDISKRTGFDIAENVIVKKIMSPMEWADTFNLYRGSGLGLAHGMNQIGAFRPKNKDEEFRNLYYVGASTIPGTGLPMVIISSKLTAERIEGDYGPLS